jgi:hypothetical protein
MIQEVFSDIVEDSLRLILCPFQFFRRQIQFRQQFLA